MFLCCCFVLVIGPGGGGRFFALQGRSHFLRFFALPCIPCYLSLNCSLLVPYMDKFVTQPVVAEQDENDDDGCPDLEDKGTEKGQPLCFYII